MKGEIYAPTRLNDLPVNLLDNSNFRASNIINQYNYVSGTSLGDYEMILDRWRNERSVNGYTLSPEGLITTPQSSFYQAVAGLRNDGIYTFAVGTSMGLYTVSCTLAITGTWYIMGTTDTPFGHVRIDDAGYGGVVNCLIRSYNSVVVYWAALYEGAYTVDTLPSYTPRPYSIELAECQRYYWRVHFDQYETISMGYEGPEYAFLQLSAPVQMRAKNLSFAQSAAIHLGGYDRVFVGAKCIGTTIIMALNYPSVQNYVGSAYGYTPIAEGVTLTFSAEL